MTIPARHLQTRWISNREMVLTVLRRYAVLSCA